MKIDLHIHTKTYSDGNLHIEEVFREAKKRNLDLMSTTDHDSIDGQERAIALAKEHGITYITGVELNITFQYPPEAGKSISLDFLGYQYDIGNHELKNKLELIRGRREIRAREILEKLNAEFDKENIARFDEEDIKKTQDSVDGVFGRPHIAKYLVEKGVVSSHQEAFDRYLVKCDVPKFPLSIAEASRLIRNAGGIFLLAHPNDPNGTSLVSITPDLDEQTKIIERHITLDRSMWGTDQAASVEPHGLIKLVRDIRIIERASGHDNKQVLESEKAYINKLRKVIDF